MPIVPSMLRSCLALVLAGAFGFRVATAPVALGCMTGGASATAPHHSGHHQHEHRAPGSPPPACECVAHGPGPGIAVEPSRLAPAEPPRVESVPAATLDHSVPPAAVAHVLPFSIGPPALLG